MSKLLQLLIDFHLFEAVFAHIRSQRDFLSLALSCRILKEFIIPQFLFSRVCFRATSRYDPSDWPQVDNTTNSLRHLVTGDDSVYYDAVRCIEILGSTEVRSDDLQRMRNLHTLALRHSNDVRELSTSVLAQTRLRHLKVERCSEFALMDLRNLSGLHGLSLGFRDPVYLLTPDSSLGRVLSNSRDTLRALSLDGIVWQLHPSCSRRAIEQGDLVWPHVRELYLRVVKSAGRSARSEKSLFPNLALTFPSTRHFYLPSTKANHTLDIYSLLFVSQLESIRGNWADIGSAIDTGATLRRAIVCLGDTDYTVPFKSYLVPSLESLTLISERSIRPYPLKELSDITPHLKFLRLRFTATSFISFGETLEWALGSVSHLSLRYMHISCALYGGCKEYGKSNTPDAKIERHVQSAAETASDMFPSLRALSVEWSNGRVDWHRNINENGVVGLCREPNADGMADEMYYDWGETEDLIPWAVNMKDQ
ncbi:hypothetical protein BOTBODRAFT_170412 [Botryobasidium botryosum FD-172 SS1]|uniref:F-box domain-containing protein n=1 Tax=Botryobasidium botryosum (strain FD-172 SS1) TaxID=930990 RepID=A0A067N5A5_BOTB1|nr:hypothetical protein BOTBODRAFT_170412 [Botryobasidium botryosum FD-172 SS1]